MVFAIGLAVGALTMQTLDGREITMSNYGERRGTLVLFLSSRSPACQSSIETIKRVHEKYRRKEVLFVGLYANDAEGSDELRVFRLQHALSFPIYRDPGGTIAKQFDARITPEAFLLDEKAVLRYRGGFQPDEAAQDLDATLEHFLAGRPLPRDTFSVAGTAIGEAGVKGSTDDPVEPIVFSSELIFKKVPFAIDHHCSTIAEAPNDDLLAVWFSGVSAAEFRVGVAKRNITPNPLLPVSGGVGRPTPTERALGDLWVRVMVLENNGTRVAIVGIDSLGFPGKLCDRARARVSGVPPENILIGVTHTHSAPDAYGFPNGEGRTGADFNYLFSVTEKIAEAIHEATDGLKPAGLKIATGEARGKIAYNYYAEQLYDPRCHVIQAVGKDGEVIGTLVNYAIHPEVLGPDQGILSPDLVGPLYDRIEAKAGGMALFMGGAQGGMVTADCRDPDGKNVKTWDECVRIGELLADEALRIVADAPVQPAPALFCTAKKVTFPVTSPLMKELLTVLPQELNYGGTDSVTTQINLVNVGNAQIITVPGEALPNVGYYLKRKMRGEHNLLFGNTNDAYAYILTKVDYDSFKRYQYISRTSLGEMTGEILIEEVLKLVDECPRPERLSPQ